MQLEDYFDFQRLDDIRLKGTRVGIENILYLQNAKQNRPKGVQMD